MRRFLPSTSVLFVLACEPSTGGLKEADEVGDADDSGTDDSTGSDDICTVGSLGCTCTPGGGCDPGLECVSDMCMQAGDSESESESTEDESSESATETDTGTCTSVGCACEDIDGACDPGLICDNGTCQPNPCGNGALDVGEQCDDGNQTDIDGCDSDCTFTEVLALAAGDRHNCALIEGGRIRCWGEGFFGQLGRGNVDNIGDNETPGSAGDLPLPPATMIDAGEAHTCGFFDDLSLRCWGQNYYGQLGYGNSAMVPLLGDDETIDMLAAVDLGGAPLTSFALGGRHGCARLTDSKVRCWGGNAYGQLGLANLIPIGDDEAPSTAGAMFLGANAAQVATGDSHTCVITDMGYARCWGRASRGQLGYANNQNIGDSEPPANVGDLILVPASLPVNTPATAFALGREHTCVLFETGDVVCWGFNDAGQLATGNNQDWGDQNGETPSLLEPIDLGGPAIAIAAGSDHNCALLDDGSVRCWGENEKGQLGLGDTVDVGIDMTPAEAGPVGLGGPAIAIVAGGEHSCALLEDYTVICWGTNIDGRLGYGHTQPIGDNEDPEIAGGVELW